MADPMKPITLTPFDPAEHLKTPPEVAAYLNDAFKTGSPEEIVHAIDVAARARARFATSD